MYCVSYVKIHPAQLNQRNATYCCILSFTPWGKKIDKMFLTLLYQSKNILSLNPGASRGLSMWSLHALPCVDFLPQSIRDILHLWDSFLVPAQDEQVLKVNG